MIAKGGQMAKPAIEVRGFRRKGGDRRGMNVHRVLDAVAAGGKGGVERLFPRPDHEERALAEARMQPFGRVDVGFRPGPGCGGCRHTLTAAASLAHHEGAGPVQRRCGPGRVRGREEVRHAPSSGKSAASRPIAASILAGSVPRTTMLAP